MAKQVKFACTEHDKCGYISEMKISMPDYIVPCPLMGCPGWLVRIIEEKEADK